MLLISNQDAIKRLRTSFLLNGYSSPETLIEMIAADDVKSIANCEKVFINNKDKTLKLDEYMKSGACFGRSLANIAHAVIIRGLPYEFLSSKINLRILSMMYFSKVPKEILETYSLSSLRENNIETIALFKILSEVTSDPVYLKYILTLGNFSDLKTLCSYALIFPESVEGPIDFSKNPSINKLLDFVNLKFSTLPFSKSFLKIGYTDQLVQSIIIDIYNKDKVIPDTKVINHSWSKVYWLFKNYRTKVDKWTSLLGEGELYRPLTLGIIAGESSIENIYRLRDLISNYTLNSARRRSLCDLYVYDPGILSTLSDEEIATKVEDECLRNPWV